jgi:peroxiredoxin
MSFSGSHLVFAVLTLAVCPWLGAAPHSGESTSKARKPGSALEVNTLDGKVLKVHQMKGKVVLVDFMTTICPTCKIASAGLQELNRELASKGLCTVGVALNVDSPSALKEYRQGLGLTFPLGIISHANAVHYLEHPPDKPLMVPTLVLLDRRGRVCSVEVGWRGIDAVRASVLKLLAE